MTNRRKLIGLLGHKHSGTYNPGYGQNAAYVEFFRKFGDIIIIDAQCETVIPVDMLVLPGGRDVNPARYGQKPILATQVPDMEYEWFFANMFDKYLTRCWKNEVAIYGICAGFQNMVVELGGSIQQDYIQDQSTSWRGDLVDVLTLNDDFLKYDNDLTKDYHKYKNNVNYYKTNSIHHQSVLLEDLTDDFEILATNKKHDNIEFILHKNIPMAAEQSHPEERSNPYLTISIINKLLNTINNE